MYLCFTCDGGHVADLLGAQCVYHRALANVWIANEPHTDLLLVGVQLFKEMNTRHTHQSERPGTNRLCSFAAIKNTVQNYRRDLV